MAEEEVEEVVVTGRDVFSGAAPLAPFDVGGMAAALAAYNEALASAVAAYVPPELATVVVTAPAPPKPPLPPPSVLDDLLSRPVGSTAPAAPTEFERLLNKPPPTEFEKLLEKPRAAPLPEVTVTASRVGNVLRAMSRFAGPVGVAGLLPTMYHAGVRLDDLATDSWTRRLFGDEPREGDADRSSKPAPKRPASIPDSDMPQVTVKGRAPRPSPLALPLFGGLPGMGDMVGEVEILAEPTPRPKTGGNPLGMMPPGIIPPSLLELTSPLPSPRPSPRPGQPGPAPPGPGEPTRRPPRGPLAPPLTWPSGLGDPCQCPKQTKTKKKKQPRNVCYRGSYVEGQTSLKKKPLERVSCQTGKPI